MSDEKPDPVAAALAARLDAQARRRDPRPADAYGLPEAVLKQLQDAPIDPTRPLLALDADEVLLDFADHLGRWMQNEGWRMDLTEYRLEGAIRRIDDGRPADRTEVSGLIDRFFASEAEHMKLAEGAGDAVEALSSRAQILVLTNVPLAQREARIRCLKAQGIDRPLVANEGGKGKALRWLWDRTEAPIAFVDDADAQLGSAKSHAPGIFTLHYVASDGLRRLVAGADNADARADSWPEATDILTRALRAPGAS